MAELRKYGAPATILFPLVAFGKTDYESTPVAHAAGDSQISKDEGNFANTENAFAHEGNGIYSIALTMDEVAAARVIVTIIDQTSPKAWEDQAVLVDTYGNASAQHAFDLDTADVTVAAASKTGYALASDGLDSVATTAPAGVAANFREMLVQLWRRFFKKSTLTATELKTYADNGTDVLTTQTVSDDGTTQSQGASS